MESDDPTRAAIARLDDLAPMKIEHGARFGATARRMTIVAGARGLGCTHYEVAPGKVAAMGSASLDFADPPWIRGVFRADATVGYYDGEDSYT